MPRIAVIYYSVHGHVRKLAEQVFEGIQSVEGCEPVMFQIAETLPPEVLEKIKPEPRASYPTIKPEQLPHFDGLIFGVPTRFGMMPSQVKALWDATGGLWASGALVGKPTAAFCSVASQGGGTETTIMTALTQFTHHGMIFVPPGYSFGSDMFNTDAVKAGSPWGAATFAGADGGRQPSEVELAYAMHQGAYFAGVVKRLTPPQAK